MLLVVRLKIARWSPSLEAPETPEGVPFQRAEPQYRRPLVWSRPKKRVRNTKECTPREESRVESEGERDHVSLVELAASLRNREMRQSGQDAVLRIPTRCERRPRHVRYITSTKPEKISRIGVSAQDYDAPSFGSWLGATNDEVPVLRWGGSSSWNARKTCLVSEK